MLFVRNLNVLRAVNTRLIRYVRVSIFMRIEYPFDSLRQGEHFYAQ